MDLQDLRVFQAVATEGGITRAAAKLGRVQSSVTARIQALEADLSVTLFRRESKQMRITPQGEILLKYTAELLDLAARARDAVTDDTPRGPYRLGAMESTAAVRLPVPLANFYRRYPEVTLTLKTGNPVELTNALLAGELDGALMAEPLQSERLRARPVFRETLILISRADQPEPPSDNRILVFENGCPHRKRLEAHYQNSQSHPLQTIEMGSYHAIFGALMAGMGTALVPESVLSAYPDQSMLRRTALPENYRTLDTLFVWPEDPPSVITEAMLSVLPHLDP